MGGGKGIPVYEGEGTEFVIRDIREESGRVSGEAEDKAGVMLGFEEGMRVPAGTDRRLGLELEGRETGHSTGRTMGGTTVSTSEVEERTWASIGEVWERTMGITGETGERTGGATEEAGEWTVGATG